MPVGAGIVHRPRRSTVMPVTAESEPAEVGRGGIHQSPDDELPRHLIVRTAIPRRLAPRDSGTREIRARRKRASAARARRASRTRQCLSSPPVLTHEPSGNDLVVFLSGAAAVQSFRYENRKLFSRGKSNGARSVRCSARAHSKRAFMSWNARFWLEFPCQTRHRADTPWQPFSR